MSCTGNLEINFPKGSQSWKPFFSMHCHLSNSYQLPKNPQMRKVRSGIRKTGQFSGQLWMPTLTCFSPVIRIFWNHQSQNPGSYPSLTSWLCNWPRKRYSKNEPVFMVYHVLGNCNLAEKCSQLWGALFLSFLFNNQYLILICDISDSFFEPSPFLLFEISAPDSLHFFNAIHSNLINIESI